VALEVGERAVIERALVGGAQHDARRLARLERLGPARRAQAPAVAGLEAGEAELRHRRRQIVAGGFGEFEERGGGDDANRMAAAVIRAGVAAAVAVEAGHRLDRAVFERAAEHVERRRAPGLAAALAGTGIERHRVSPRSSQRMMLCNRAYIRRANT